MRPPVDLIRVCIVPSHAHRLGTAAADSMPSPTLGAKPTILASWFCPFAQRTLIAANAKQVEYRLATQLRCLNLRTT
jgi:glutathionyl-hydroquinone reductase